ncbi:MAG: segregation/condensation protein A, partial [Candidatus Kapaibacteriales bacterium]
ENLIKDISKKYIFNIEISDLINSLKKLIEDNKIEQRFTEIKNTSLHIDREIHRIENIVSSQGQINFSKLVRSSEKPYVIISFLAILELIKLKKVLALQNNQFNDFIVFSIKYVN